MRFVFGLMMFFGGPLALLIGLIRPSIYRGGRLRALGIGAAVSMLGLLGALALTTPDEWEAIRANADRATIERGERRARAAEEQRAATAAVAQDAAEQEARRAQEAEEQAAREREAQTRADACRPVGPNDAEPLGGYACPGEQRMFMAILEEYRKAFGAEANPIRHAELRRERAGRLCEVLRSGWVQDWRGTLRGMTVTGSGRVGLSVDLQGAFAASFETSGADASRLAEMTQVQPASPLYATLRTLQPGQRVVFSGEIIRGREDCGLGSRETDVQMMLGPRWYFRFTEMRAAD